MLRRLALVGVLASCGVAVLMHSRPGAGAPPWTPTPSPSVTPRPLPTWAPAPTPRPTVAPAPVTPPPQTPAPPSPTQTPAPTAAPSQPPQPTATGAPSQAAYIVWGSHVTYSTGVAPDADGWLCAGGKRVAYAIYDMPGQPPWLYELRRVGTTRRNP